MTEQWTRTRGKTEDQYTVGNMRSKLHAKIVQHGWNRAHLPREYVLLTTFVYPANHVISLATLVGNPGVLSLHECIALEPPLVVST